MDGVLITGFYYSKILCKDYFLKSKTGTKIEIILCLCKCTTGIIIFKKGFFLGGGVQTTCRYYSLICMPLYILFEYIKDLQSMLYGFTND